MTVAELIEQLQQFPPEMEVKGYCGNGETAEAFEILSPREGEVDGGIYVDTACDGVYSGKERKVVQIPHML